MDIPGTQQAPTSQPDPAPAVPAEAPPAAAPEAAPAPSGMPVQDPAVPAPSLPTKTVGQLPLPQTGSSFDWAGTSAFDTSQTSARLNTAGMQNVTPDRAAKVLDLATRAQVAPSLIQDDPEGFEKELNTANFSAKRLVEKYPKLADWMAQNPMHLPLVKDDIDNFKKMQDDGSEYSMLHSAFDAVGAGLGQVYAQTARIPGLAYDVAALPQNILANVPGFESLRTRASDLPADNRVAQYYENQSKIFTDRNSDLNDSINDEVQKGNYSKAGRVAFAKMVNGAPQLAQMLVGGMQFHTAKLLLMGAQQAAGAEQRTENKDAGPVASTVDALTQGTIAAGAGEFGNFGILQKWGATLAENYGQTAARAIVKSFASTLTYSFARDASSQAALSVANDLADYSTGVNPHALEGTVGRGIEGGVVGGLTGALMASPGAAVSMHVSANEMRQAQLTKDFYLSLNDTAAQSKTKARLPEKYQEAVNSMTKDGPIDSIHIDPKGIETFYQTKGPEEQAKFLSSLDIEKKFDAAKESGGLIKVPMGDFANKVAGTEIHQALADHITFDPEKNPTVHQARENEAMAAELEQRIVQHGGDPEEHGSSVIEQTTKKLMAVGQDRPTAEKNATLYHFFNVQAQSEGLHPDELYKQYGLNISRELPETLKSKNIDEFDPMLNKIREGKIPTEKQAYGPSLSEFLRSEGGINHLDQGAEVRDMGLNGVSKPRKGMDFDRAVERAHEAGYISERDPQHLLDALTKEKNGQRVTSPENHTPHADEREVLKSIEDHIKSQGADIHATDNETLKKVLEEGQKKQPDNLFEFLQGDQKSPMGGIRFMPGETHIALMKDANMSTFIHETGHFFVKVIKDLAEKPGASERTKEIYQSLRKFSGVEEGKEFGVEHHERLAEGFEKYVMEGKAPSSKMRQAFAAFKAWMIHAYKSLVAHPGVTLTPEVRQAFDRMLATDREISQYRNELGSNPMISDPRSMMKEQDAEKYIDLSTKARQASDDHFLAENMKMFEKERSRQYRIERKMVEREINEEVSIRPEYQVIDAIQNGVERDGEKTSLKLDRKSMVADYGEQIVKQMPDRIFGKDGLDYHTVAGALDLDSGHELAMMLANAHNKDEVVQQKVQQEMDARYAHMDPQLSGQAMEEAASDALHNTNESERMAFELKWMMENKLPQYKELMKKVGKRVMTAKDYAEQAQTITNRTSTRDLKPYIYQRAETKSSNEAMTHALRGDWDKAFEAKSQALLSHELYKSTKAAQDYVHDGLDGFKDFHQNDEKLQKTRDMDLINAGRVILDRFGISSVERGKTADKYIEKLKNYDDAGDQYNAIKSQIDAALQNAKHYGDLSYDNFISLKDTVDSLWNLSRSSKQVMIDGLREDIQTAKDAIKARAEEFSKGGSPDYKGEGHPGNSDNFKTKAISMVSQLYRVESWCKAMDNGDINGAFTKYIWRPIKEASTEYRLRKEEIEHKVNELTKKYLGDLSQKPIDASELGEGVFFKKESDLIGALLHTGNNSNLQKLLVGRGWGSLDEHGNLDRSNFDHFLVNAMEDGRVQQKHFEYAQEVWDLLESMKPESQKAHKERYGNYFEEIPADKVVTKWGDYRGGYVPAKVDMNINTDSQSRQLKSSLETNSQSTMWPSKMDGWSKKRVDQYNAPLSLNLDMINSHIDDVMKFTYLAPRVNDVARTILDKEVSKSLDSVHKNAIQDILGPWLKRSMNQSTSVSGTPAALDPVFRYLRSNSGMQTMFLNMRNIILQAHGLSLAAVAVRPDFLARAGKEYMSSPSQMAEMVSGKSDYMKTKLNEQGIDMTKSLRDIAEGKSNSLQFIDFARKNTYFIQTAVQNQVNLITWHGAYDHAISTGGSERDAINTADAAVSQTQHNFAPESMSNIEHSNPFFKMFLQFYSYQNLKMNLLGSEFYQSMRYQGLAKGAMRASYVYGLGAMVPALLMVGLGKALSGKSWNETGDSSNMEFLSEFGMSQIHDVTAMVPFVGQAMNEVIDRSMGKKRGFDDRAYNAALESFMAIKNSVTEIPQALKEGKFNHKVVNDGLSAIGTLTGVPAKVLAKPINYLNDINSGKAKSSGSIDFARGLITGQSGK